MQDDIKAFAIKQGFQDAREIGQYNGSTVYQPVFTDGRRRMVGYPQYIMVSDGHISLKVDSTFEITDRFFPD